MNLYNRYSFYLGCWNESCYYKALIDIDLKKLWKPKKLTLKGYAYNGMLHHSFLRETYEKQLSCAKISCEQEVTPKTEESFLLSIMIFTATKGKFLY